MQTVFLPPISDVGPNGYTGAAAGQHYLKVDENPHDGDSSFLNVFLNQSEAYGIDVSAIPAGASILAVRVRFAIKGAASDQSSSRAGIRIGGVDYLGPAHEVGIDPSYTIFTDADMETSPASGVLWTKEELAGAAWRHVPVSQPADLPRPRLSQLVGFADIVLPPERPRARVGSASPFSAVGSGSPPSRVRSGAPAAALSSGAPGARARSTAPAGVTGSSSPRTAPSSRSTFAAPTAAEFARLKVRVASSAPRAIVSSPAPAVKVSSPDPFSEEA